MTTYIQPTGKALRVSVVVITWNRPEHVRECLTHLYQMAESPHEVLVVDASSDSRTKAEVDAFPDARLISFPGGAGHMTRSRNKALLHVTGDVVAYLDDDAYVRPGWLAGLVQTYTESDAWAVAGRTCDQGTEKNSPGLVGLLLPSGDLTGNFHQDTEKTVDIDHGIGANMSFRREALALLGGFRDDYPGSALREDTDIFLRLKRLGYRSVFTPRATVDHVGAPHVKGRRFDWRYQFWAHHNHVLLLCRYGGFMNRQLVGWSVRSMRRSFSMVEPGNVRSLTRPVVAVSAVILGLVSALRSHSRDTQVVRIDAAGIRIRKALFAGVGTR